MKILIILTTLALMSCTDSDGTQKLLKNQGYKEIQTLGYSWFSCSKDDFYATAFAAKSSGGENVRGVVCSGLLFKGSTVRYFN